MCKSAATNPVAFRCQMPESWWTTRGAGTLAVQHQVINNPNHRVKSQETNGNLAPLVPNASRSDTYLPLQLRAGNTSGGTGVKMVFFVADSVISQSDGNAAEPCEYRCFPNTFKHCPYHATVKQQHRHSVYDRETPRCLWYFAYHAAKLRAVVAPHIWRP